MALKRHSFLIHYYLYVQLPIWSSPAPSVARLRPSSSLFNIVFLCFGPLKRPSFIHIYINNNKIIFFFFHNKFSRRPPTLTPDINVVSWDLLKYNIDILASENIFNVFFFSKFLDPKSQICRCATMKRISFSVSATPTYIYYMPTTYPSDTPFVRKKKKLKKIVDPITFFWELVEGRYIG